MHKRNLCVNSGHKTVSERSESNGFTILRRSSGFTIVELLVVIVVIGILAAITIVSYTGISNKATVASIQSDLTNASNQLKLYYTTYGSYPTTLNASYCPTAPTADNNYCLKPSSGNILAYSSVSPNTFHLTNANNTISYSINDSTAPTISTTTNGSSVGNSCPTGYIPVPGSGTYSTNDFCVMKYEAKNVSGVATSQAALTPWVSISQTTSITTAAAACTGCHLITEAEWLTIAQNVLSVASNWDNGAGAHTVGTGYVYSGNNDSVIDTGAGAALNADTNDNNGYYRTANTAPSNQKRTLTLTNGEVIWDMAGNVYEWASGQTTGGQPGITGEAAFAWKDWNATSMTPANFSPAGPNPFPAYGTPAASGWNAATNGIGRLYSYVSDSSLRGFLRGGSYSDGNSAGVLALHLGVAPGGSGTSIGFRVSR